jgi:lipid II:glycine glycyltransferase (peptidoglycan interpeptide bridge formation enzyme)
MAMRVSESSDYVGDEAVSIFQSDFWAAFKAEFGWKPRLFEVETPATRTRLLLLLRSLPAGLCFAYVPNGPDLDPSADERASLLAELSVKLRPFLPRACLFVRFDPPWYSVEGSRSEATEENSEAGSALRLRVEASRPAIGPPLRRAVSDVQPPDTVLIDLRPSEEEILAAMKSKWRYNVRQAQKKGVVVDECGIEGIPEFFTLARATSARDRIALRSEGYYARLFSLAAELEASGAPGCPELRLWIARHEGRALAANITLFRGKEAVYLYGSSSDAERNLMPTYSLQWAAMRAAKARGCLSYDLYGIPPTEDPDHPMAGLYRFKTGFGGEIAHRAGSWDYPLSALGYAAYRAAEASRSWWYKDFKKRRTRPRRPPA